MVTALWTCEFLQGTPHGKNDALRFLGVLVLPGAKANGWDFSARVELERSAIVSHSELLSLWLYGSSNLRESAC